MTSSSSCFCLYDEQIETHLQTMHVRQRLRGDVQHEIDRYLVACISCDLRHLVLPRNNVPHYDNLPDISSYALGVLDPSMDMEPELQQVLLLLRQCTPLRRRTKRAQRELQWREDSLFPMQTLVRCMQGTMLGLYPNCLKAVAFGARIGLLRFLRTLLVQPFARLHACMQRIPYIIKLAVMEHMCNTIYDYHPGICHTLNRSGQKVEHFCNSVSTICDIFRGELNTHFCTAAAAAVGSEATGLHITQHKDTAIILSILPRLEKIAHSYFERCTRAYRGIIVGSVQAPHSIDHARRLCLQLFGPAHTNQHSNSSRSGNNKLPPKTQAQPRRGTADHVAEEKGIPSSIEELLLHIRVASSQSVFDVCHSHLWRAPAVRDLAWHLTQTVRVHPLPLCIAQRQHDALLRRYSGDTTCVMRCRVLHLCIQCVIRRGSVQGTRLRHDCLTDKLMCMHCGEGTVLTVDLFGRLVSVANETLFLSACCGSFVYYNGSGHEFSTTCGPQCAPERQLYRKRERLPLSSSSSSSSSNANTNNNNNNKAQLIPSPISSAVVTPARAQQKQQLPAPLPLLCLICRQRHSIQQHVRLLDVPSRTMITYPLCSKHVVPQHILHHVMDVHTLLRFFHQQQHPHHLHHHPAAGGGAAASHSHPHSRSRLSRGEPEPSPSSAQQPLRRAKPRSKRPPLRVKK